MILVISNLFRMESKKIQEKLFTLFVGEQQKLTKRQRYLKKDLKLNKTLEVKDVNSRRTSKGSKYNIVYQIGNDYGILNLASKLPSIRNPNIDLDFGNSTQNDYFKRSNSVSSSSTAIKRKDPKSLIENYFKSSEISRSFDFSSERIRKMEKLLDTAKKVKKANAPPDIIDLRRYCEFSNI